MTETIMFFVCFVSFSTISYREPLEYQVLLVRVDVLVLMVQMVIQVVLEVQVLLEIL